MTGRNEYWMDRAECRDDPGFYDRPQWEQLPVCFGCPVRTECLTYAGENGLYGMFGGVVVRRPIVAFVECAHCGREIEHPGHGRKFCSDRCRFRGQGTSCIDCGRPITRGSARCRKCLAEAFRQPLTPDDPRHGTRRGAIAHRREGTMCEACKIAMRNYRRSLKTRVAA